MKALCWSHDCSGFYWQIFVQAQNCNKYLHAAILCIDGIFISSRSKGGKDSKLKEPGYNDLW